MVSYGRRRSPAPPPLPPDPLGTTVTFPAKNLTPYATDSTSPAALRTPGTGIGTGNALDSQTQVYLSVVVPAWNRPEQLEHTIGELRAFLSSRPYSTELVVVDDHSDPGAQTVLDHLLRSTPGLSVLRNDRNRGKGYSTRRGLLAASGRYRIFTDADLAYPTHEITRILRRLEHGADVAVACRALPGSRVSGPGRQGSYGAARQVLSRSFNTLVQRIMLPGILDTQAGLKGFTAAAVEEIFPRVRVRGFAFDVEALVIAQRHGLRIVQEAVECREDDGPSTVRIGAEAARMARDVLRICFNRMLARYD
ncbi:MAG: glycosyltransferase family 2 protein [Gemmatimonadaceae bacterium]